jgi:3-methyladenine DNA glycosylase/8-oxoguanine DNA glycosylase
VDVEGCMQSIEAIIKPRPPFNFDGTVFVPHYFPTPDFEWRPGVVWQALNIGGKLLGLRMRNEGEIHQPQIKLTIYARRRLSDGETKEVAKELAWRYGFDEDISGFFEEFEGDKFLKPAFKRLRGTRVNCANSLYELLIISIVLQNATVKRTVQMMNNLFEAYGTKLRFDRKGLFAYWNAEDLDKVNEEDLKALKVGYRAKMIKLVSEAFARGDIEEPGLRRMSTEEARKELMKLYGVGPATAENLLGGYLRKYDTFNLKGKLWEQKILSRILFKKKLVPADEIIGMFNKTYGKWRGLAFHYIFTDLFWRHKEKKIDWLEKEIRL